MNEPDQRMMIELVAGIIMAVVIICKTLKLATTSLLTTAAHHQAIPDPSLSAELNESETDNNSNE